MRKIKLECNIVGYTTIFKDNNYIYSLENNEIEVEVVFPEEYSTYTKRLDIFVNADSSVDFIEGTTDNTLTVILDRSKLKEGLVYLQPIAYILDSELTYEESIKQKWKTEFIEVKNSINAQESTTTIPISLYEELLGRINTLEEAISSINIANKMNINADNSNVNVLTFQTDVVEQALEAGEMQYSPTDGTVNVGMNGGNVIGSLLLENYYHIQNNSDRDIEDGELCMFSGSTGASGKLYAAPWDTVSPEFVITGLATERIPRGAFGYITWHGPVKGIPTNGALYGETWLKDDILYPSLTHRGGLTKVPNSMQPVVTVLFAHATNGQLYCRAK